MTRKGDGRQDDVKCGEFTVVRVSEGAVLLDPGDGGDETWIPKSQLRGDGITEDSDPGDSGELILPRWLAEKEGFC